MPSRARVFFDEIIFDSDRTKARNVDEIYRHPDESESRPAFPHDVLTTDGRSRCNWYNLRDRPSTARVSSRFRPIGADHAKEPSQ